MTIHIEKLYKDEYFKQNERGIIELFKHTEKNTKLYQDWCWENVQSVYGETVLQHFEYNNIKLAEKFGIEGITIKNSLNSWFQGIDTQNLDEFHELQINYYEIPFVVFKQLNFKQRNHLLKHFNIILTCLNHNQLINEETLEYLCKIKFIKNCIIVSSGEYIIELNDNSRKINTITFPFFLLSTVSKAIVDKQIIDKPEFVMPKKLALVPVHKPRYHRIKILNTLEKNNLLEDCDWSCVYNADASANQLGFHGLNTSKFKHPHMEDLQDPDTKYFLSKYKSVLPRVLPNMKSETMSDVLIFNKDYFGKYKWVLSIESYDTFNHCSEKTFKGFLIGAGVIVIPNLENYDLLKKYGFKVQEITESDIAQLDKIQLNLDYVKHNYYHSLDYAYFSKILVDNISIIKEHHKGALYFKD